MGSTQDLSRKGLQKKIVVSHYIPMISSGRYINGDRERLVFTFKLITMVKNLLNLGSAGIGILSNHEPRFPTLPQVARGIIPSLDPSRSRGQHPPPWGGDLTEFAVTTRRPSTVSFEHDGGHPLILWFSAGRVAEELDLGSPFLPPSACV